MALLSVAAADGLKAARLKAYLRQVCDNERRALERNDALLRNMTRIDEHVAALDRKSTQLRAIKVCPCVMVACLKLSISVSLFNKILTLWNVDTVCQSLVI